MAVAQKRSSEYVRVAGVADGGPIVPAEVDVSVKNDGGAEKIVVGVGVYNLRQSRQLLGGGDGVLGLGVARVVPAGVGGAVPGVDGALGPRDGGREECGDRERERRDDAD